LAVAHLVIILLLAGLFFARLLPRSTLIAITGGQQFVLGVWLAMGGGRLSYRLGLVAIVLGLTAALAPEAQISPKALLTIPGFLSFALILCGVAGQLAIVSLPLILLRATKWRVVHSSEMPPAVGGSRLPFRVSHLIGLVAFVGGLLVLRAIVQSFGTVQEDGGVESPRDHSVILMITVTVFLGRYCLLAAAVVTAVWACLGPPRSAYRLTILAIVVVLLCALPIQVAGGAAQVSWAVRTTITMAVVIASLLLLRCLGVRIADAKALSQVPTADGPA
jgi:hypothetical protein